MALPKLPKVPEFSKLPKDEWPQHAEVYRADVDRFMRELGLWLLLVVGVIAVGVLVWQAVAHG